MPRIPSWLSLPPPAPARVVNASTHGFEIYIGHGSPFSNPFLVHREYERESQVEAFRQWLPSQPELLRLGRSILPGKILGSHCPPRLCHGEVWSEVAEGLWDHLIPDEPVLVFGSNLAGRHGAGAARAARHEYGAELGVGRGRTGHAYALPTKDCDLRSLSITRVLEEIDAFFAEAEATPETQYRFTRVGCGLAELSEAPIQDYVMTKAPANVQLPGTWWVQTQSRAAARVAVSAPKGFGDYDLLAAKLNGLLSRLDQVELVTSGLQGSDPLVERFAVARGLLFRRIPPYWHGFNKAALSVRSQRISWYSSHLIAFWDGVSDPPRAMIRLGERDKLNMRVILTT